MVCCISAASLGSCCHSVVALGAGIACERVSCCDVRACAANQCGRGRGGCPPSWRDWVLLCSAADVRCIQLLPRCSLFVVVIACVSSLGAVVYPARGTGGGDRMALPSGCRGRVNLLVVTPSVHVSLPCFPAVPSSSSSSHAFRRPEGRAEGDPLCGRGMVRIALPSGCRGRVDLLVVTPSVHVSLLCAQPRATCLRGRVSRYGAADGLSSCRSHHCVPSFVAPYPLASGSSFAKGRVRAHAAWSCRRCSGACSCFVGVCPPCVVGVVAVPRVTGPFVACAV